MLDSNVTALTVVVLFIMAALWFLDITRVVRILAVALWAMADGMDAFSDRYREAYRNGRQCIQNKIDATGPKRADMQSIGHERSYPIKRAEMGFEYGPTR